MTDTSEPPQIPITDLKQGSAALTEQLHFTGGWRAYRTGQGWAVGPLLRNGDLVSIEGIREERLSAFGASIGLTLIGADETSWSNPHLPARIWTPLLGLPRLQFVPSDSWGMIGVRAQQAGDAEHAGLARNISVSLRAAAMQLRNASDEYGKQLLAGLRSDQRVGGRYKNIPMIDLHLAFHSVLTEMASARDYLAQLAARRVNAPDNIEALGRLKKWAEKPSNKSALADPLVSRLLQASDAAAPDPWLADITDYRNLFLHREPIGAIAKWLLMEERSTPHGPARMLTMPINYRPGAEETCDALTRFTDLYGRLCRLADFAVSLSPYEAKPLHFVVTPSGDVPDR